MSSSGTLLAAVQEKTGGRPFVLVVMAYEDKQTGADLRRSLFGLIRDVAETQFNRACLRADDLGLFGQDLRGKIHELIDLASIVIVEISEPRPNVFYEYGYAMGRGKTPVPLLQKGCRAPYDLQGVEALEYEMTFDGAQEIRRLLGDHLTHVFRPNLPLLHKMLAPCYPQPSYIIASPKYPSLHSTLAGQVRDRRTFGDNLGVLGVISAFGLFYGEARDVELVGAQHADDKILGYDCNLYLIGSEKVNKPIGDLLPFMMAGPHSLGTAAACLAATRVSLIKKVEEALPAGTLADKSRTFWALVKGTISDDYHLDEEGVSIEEVGVYE